jgi:ribosomal protein S18 acetylase RimI-like enzyme
MSGKITRRAATEQDEGFLFELFKSVRMPDFAQLPLPPAQIDMLLKIQYAGQKQTYHAQYPDGDEIVLLDRKPVGRIWVYRGPAEHQLVDIALMPECRNCGIGAGLVTGAIEAARAAGVRLSCSVAVQNTGSLRFHERLGFRVVRQNEVRYSLAVEP